MPKTSSASMGTASMGTSLRMCLSAACRIWVSVLVMSGLAGGALADPNNLRGGVLIQHFDSRYMPSPGYEPPPGGWCATYALYPIQSLQEVNAQLAPGAVVWFVVAAWEEDKTCCGVEFGFGAYDPSLINLQAYGPCFPVNGLEIPTAGWPGPDEGTAFVTTGTPWSGNYMPVYSFSGYAYDYSHGATVIPLSVDPPTGFCGFCNCTNPPQMAVVGPEQRGDMGINMQGVVPVFPPPPAIAACCLGQPLGACVMLTEEECGLAAGTWLGEGTACEPVNPCPQPGACCTAGYCHVVLEENCALLGGTFQGAGTICEPNPCPAVCCYYAPGIYHPCEILLEADCLAIPGFWHAELTTCDPNPCEAYTPTRTVTWGRIKSLYR